MDKALALESSSPGSIPCEGGILFTEEAWKKWARFVIYKKVNKEEGGKHYQRYFSVGLLIFVPCFGMVTISSSYNQTIKDTEEDTILIQ